MGQQGTTELSTAEAPDVPAALDVEPAVALDLGGEYLNAVDSKGRLVVPGPHRPAFAAGGRLLLWEASCLAVMPEASYRAFLDHLGRQLKAAVVAQAEDEATPAAALREFRRGAYDIRLDLQGRFTLPEQLRALAGIGDEVRVVGNGNRVELWPAEESEAQAEARGEARGNLTTIQSTYDMLLAEV